MIYGSVCSGIEAATVAWHPLGWRPSFFSEIEKFPRSVLKHHYQTVPLHGDFTTIKAGQYDPIDLLVGGTPCQSFSIAGLRGGITESRGNLALEFIRLAERLKPRWILWENVPGVLSSASHVAPDPVPPPPPLGVGRNGARMETTDDYDSEELHAFNCFLAGLAECGYQTSARILDAQYFGVPQRRRRVFVVGYFGDWRPAAAVLFERESLCRDITPRRETGQDVAPTISARTKGGGGLGTDFDCDGGLVEVNRSDIAASLACGGGYDNSSARTRWSGGLTAFGGNNTSGAINTATACNAKGGTGRGDFETETLIAFDCKAGGNTNFSVGELAGALRGEGHGGGHAAIAFDTAQITSKTNRSQPKLGDPCHTLHSGNTHHVAIPIQDKATRHSGGGDTRNNDGSANGMGIGKPGDPFPTLGANDIHSCFTGSSVRRLTPRECERLQGFPDDFTKITEKTADGPRYKALGNSMAVPCMRWLGQRIQMVDDLL